MFISVQELQLHQIEFNEAFQPGDIDLGADIRQQTQLDAKGRAELLEEHRGGALGTVEDIRLVGGFSTQIEVSCARCLDPVTSAIKHDFDLLYRPQGVDRRADEVSICEAETEIGYYQGDGLLLEDVLREQLLLAVPIKLVCRDECKGLCPHCGGNLNVETCNCAVPVVDERWSALKDIRDKLQS
jgi:uncharacterized protein